MDVREKLVELLDMNFGYVEEMKADKLADHLIQNGVTVQEWISVKDRLPEDMVDVMTCDTKGNIHIMWHHHDFAHPFNVGRKDLRYCPVTHWMPLPAAPKGE